MSHNVEPIEPGNKEKTIEEELDQIRQMKFKFGCLGINFIGWVIIITIILIIYFIQRQVRS